MITEFQHFQEVPLFQDRICINGRHVFSLALTKVLPLMKCLIKWLKSQISKQESNIWLVNFKILQMILMFQAIVASKADTHIPNINTDEKINPNTQIHLFLCISLIWKIPTLFRQTFQWWQNNTQWPIFFVTLFITNMKFFFVTLYL